MKAVKCGGLRLSCCLRNPHEKFVVKEKRIMRERGKECAMEKYWAFSTLLLLSTGYVLKVAMALQANLIGCLSRLI